MFFDKAPIFCGFIIILPINVVSIGKVTIYFYFQATLNTQRLHHHRSHWNFQQVCSLRHFCYLLSLFYGYISFDMSIIICHNKCERRYLLWDSLYCRHSDQTWQPVKNISMKKWNNEHIWILSNSLGRYINGTIVGVV